MAVSGRPKRRLMGEINVVPYIDVMLVLLIIFMITAPLLTQGIKVELPKAAAEPIDASAVNNLEPLVLSVDARGRLYLNVGASPQLPVDDATALARATAALRRAPRRVVLVKGDAAVNYGRIVTAMVMLQQAGASKVGFLTEPLPPPAAPQP
jgi:biopolymer transport protein TolR